MLLLRNSLPVWLVAAAVGLLSIEAVAAAAASNAASAQAESRYEKERAACLSGKSSEDSATCLKEADAARVAARKGELDKDPVSAGNATERCKVFTGVDRQACEERLSGAGTVSGSVAGGGVLRELVQTVPAASTASH